MEAVIESATAPTTETGSASTGSVTQTTPAPVVPSTTVERPSDVSSLAKYLEAKDGATPATSPPAQAAAPTVPPVEAAKPGDPALTGIPPQEKWPTILNNARTKAVEEFRQQNPIASIAPEKQREWIGIAQRMKSDPIGFVSEFIEQLERNPVWGPQLAKTFGAPAAPAAAPAAPDVEIIGPDGKPTGMTLSQLLDQRLAPELERVLGTVNERLQPILTEREQRAQETRIAEEQKALQATADQKFGRMARMLGVDPADTKHAVWGHVASIWAANPNMEPEDVALKVREQFIDPTTRTAAETSVKEDMARRASANTASTRSAGAQEARPTNHKELAAYLERKFAS